jgi:hypothetical protein
VSECKPLVCAGRCGSLRNDGLISIGCVGVGVGRGGVICQCGTAAAGDRGAALLGRATAADRFITGVVSEYNRRKIVWNGSVDWWYEYQYRGGVDLACVDVIGDRVAALLGM